MNKPQLFLLHFAGGSRYSFEFMKAHLPGFEFIPLELPGRGRRLDEDLLKNFDQAVADLFAQCCAQLKSAEFLLYGHSMGTILALKVAALLEQAGKPPLSVIVTGNPGPAIREKKERYRLGKAEFKEELRQIGGMPEEVLENDELFEFYAPILKADFELIESYDAGSLRPLRTPIYALMGSGEDNVEAIDNWKNYTSSRFQSKVLTGNHFFIYEWAKELCNVIRSCYRAATGWTLGPPFPPQACTTPLTITNHD
ncbi:MAG TPA: alpha/beta fold hydrolase [Cytophagales bacterium]|jgi:surfactin synthase thioesterase subunit